MTKLWFLTYRIGDNVFYLRPDKQVTKDKKDAIKFQQKQTAVTFRDGCVFLTLQPELLDVDFKPHVD